MSSSGALGREQLGRRQPSGRLSMWLNGQRGHVDRVCRPLRCARDGGLRGPRGVTLLMPRRDDQKGQQRQHQQAKDDGQDLISLEYGGRVVIVLSTRRDIAAERTAQRTFLGSFSKDDPERTLLCHAIGDACGPLRKPRGRPSIHRHQSHARSKCKLRRSCAGRYRSRRRTAFFYRER